MAAKVFISYHRAVIYNMPGRMEEMAQEITQPSVLP
jgi:hypothetical protein